MATFLTSAFELDPATASAGFEDVDAGDTHAVSIETLAASGITAGCKAEPLRFCPDQDVTRAQMATFLARALKLEPIGYTQVSAGGLQACAVNSGDGSIECWGDDYGEVSGAPTGGGYSQVSAGNAHACAVTSRAGSIECWGYDDRWRSEGEAFYPGASTDGGFIQVSVGGDGYACAVTSRGGYIECWAGFWEVSGVPTGGGFVQVSAGDGYACAVTSGGYVECWGADFGLVSGVPTGGGFVQVSAGNGYLCAVTSGDGSIECWGWDDYGRV